MGDEVFEAFTARLGPAARLTVERVASAVASAGSPLDRGIRWGRLTYAVDGDFDNWICGVATTRRGVSLQFHFGGLLADPDHRLIASPSRFFRKLEFASAADVDDEVVSGFVRAAVERLPFFRAHWRDIQAGRLVR